MDQIKQAVSILREGGIVVFPTDTAFAVSCKINDEKAVARLFKIRKRPHSQATPVLVDTVKMAQDYLLPIPKEVIAKLIEPYWPGALTIVLPCVVEKIPQLVRGGGATLGVRIPNHPIARAIIRQVGQPLLGPSANIHAEKTPYTMADLESEFLSKVDFVVDGACTIKQASTVIDCSVAPWKVIREGAVFVSPVIPNPFQDLKKEMPKQVRHDKLVLFIDTSSNEEIIVGLEVNRQKFFLRKPVDTKRAQIVLPMISQLLKKHKMALKDVNAIEVVKGPGSFTGLRVGVAIANTLGWALQIPVNSKKQVVTPDY